MIKIILYLIFLQPILCFNNLFADKIYANNKFLNLKNNIIHLVNNDIILAKNCKIYYECRIKKSNKILYKILQKNKIPNDIYGLRIIYSLNDESFNNNYAYYIENLIKTKYLTIDYFYDDYIQFPKKNNYQSIHIYVLNKVLMEVQIRDINMHNEAINGTASNYY